MVVFEGTSSLLKGMLIDPVIYPAGIPAAAIGSLTLTLYDKTTKTVINGRAAQNVLNANGVTLDYQGVIGQLAWALTPADLPIVTAGLVLETHIARFQAGWGVSGGGYFVASMGVLQVDVVP